MRPVSRVLVLVWRCVVQMAEPVNPQRLAAETLARQHCDDEHQQLLPVLRRLVDLRYLACNDERGNAALFWFGPHNRVPDGERRPIVYEQRAHAVAAERFVADPTPWIEPAKPLCDRAEGLEFLQHPSRRGDRLYWRDGRITDLDGAPVEERW